MIDQVSVYIVVAGLVAVVPGYDHQDNKNVVDILVLQTGDIKSDDGVSIEKHRSYIVLNDYTAKQEDIGLQKKESDPLQVLEVNLEGQAARGPWEFQDEERIPKLNRFYSGVAFRGDAEVPIEVREECLDGSDACVDASGKQLLSAKLRLTGRWAIAPIEVNEKGGILRGVVDKSEYMLIGLGATFPRFASHVQDPSPSATDGRLRTGGGPLAGGLLLKAKVPKDEVTAFMNDQEVVLEISGDCQDFAPLEGDEKEEVYDEKNDSCIVLSVVNMPYMSSRDGTRCAALPSNRIDVHFDRFYDLLVRPPVLRLLPLLSSLDPIACCNICKCCDGSSGDPPGIKCIDTVIMGIAPP